MPPRDAGAQRGGVQPCGDLGPGASGALQVAWVRFPDLAVAPVRQEYRRLDAADPAARFLYRNLESGFEGELTVDERLLVREYGPWRRVPMR